ncbi:hypothetical protein P9112_012895 [Eukaryota sp. TZLM1-RC]
MKTFLPSITVFRLFPLYSFLIISLTLPWCLVLPLFADNDTLNVLLVSGSVDSENLDETARLINSLLLHATCPLNFYVITGHGSNTFLTDYVNRLKMHNIHRHKPFSFQFQELELTFVNNSLSHLELDHHSGSYGYSKLLLDKFWDINHGLYLDTDMIVTTDPCPYFLNLRTLLRSHRRALAMAYQFSNSKNGFEPHVKYKCSGTLFFNFDEIRAIDFLGELLSMAFATMYPNGLPPKHLIGKKADYVTRGDQDYFWMLTNIYKDKTWPISMSWSLEFCHSFHGFQLPVPLEGQPPDSFGNELFMGALHLNCLGFTDRPPLENSHPKIYEVVQFYSSISPFILSLLIK